MPYPCYLADQSVFRVPLHYKPSYFHACTVNIQYNHILSCINYCTSIISSWKLYHTGCISSVNPLSIDTFLAWGTFLAIYCHSKKGFKSLIRWRPVIVCCCGRFLFMIEHVMPLCLTASWVYTVAMLVQSIVYEKEQRLREVILTALYLLQNNGNKYFYDTDGSLQCSWPNFKGILRTNSFVFILMFSLWSCYVIYH